LPGFRPFAMIRHLHVASAVRTSVFPEANPGSARTPRTVLQQGFEADVKSEPRVSTHGVLFEGSRFWVTHRRRDYGPFDYEWSQDFAGVELMYAGKKFGEYCSKEEIFADLKEFRLPTAVVDVATIVLGCLVFGVLNGFPESERRKFICDQLVAGGYDRFAQLASRPEPPLSNRPDPRRG
jgi:hypothetical protein